MTDRLTTMLARLYDDPREARIAELEAIVTTQREIIASLERALDALAVSVQGDLRVFADLPEGRGE